MIKAKGTWKVTKNDIRIITNRDFCRYYLWLFNRGTYNIYKMQLPKYGGHIGIINPNIYKNVDCSKYLHLNNKEIWFEYDIKGNMGGFNRGFKNWWLDVKCSKAEKILNDLGVKKCKGFALLHHTICNSKSLG